MATVKPELPKPTAEFQPEVFNLDLDPSFQDVIASDTADQTSVEEQEVAEVVEPTPVTPKRTLTPVFALHPTDYLSPHGAQSSGNKTPASTTQLDKQLQDIHELLVSAEEHIPFLKGYVGTFRMGSEYEQTKRNINVLKTVEEQKAALRRDLLNLKGPLSKLSRTGNDAGVQDILVRYQSVREFYNSLAVLKETAGRLPRETYYTPEGKQQNFDLALKQRKLNKTKGTQQKAEQDVFAIAEGVMRLTGKENNKSTAARLLRSKKPADVAATPMVARSITSKSQLPSPAADVAKQLSFSPQKPMERLSDLDELLGSLRDDKNDIHDLVNAYRLSKKHDDVEDEPEFNKVKESRLAQVKEAKVALANKLDKAEVKLSKFTSTLRGDEFEKRSSSLESVRVFLSDLGRLEEESIETLNEEVAKHKAQKALVLEASKKVALPEQQPLPTPEASQAVEKPKDENAWVYEALGEEDRVTLKTIEDDMGPLVTGQYLIKKRIDDLEDELRHSRDNEERTTLRQELTALYKEDSEFLESILALRETQRNLRKKALESVEQANTIRPRTVVVKSVTSPLRAQTILKAESPVAASPAKIAETEAMIPGVATSIEALKETPILEGEPCMDFGNFINAPVADLLAGLPSVPFSDIRHASGSPLFDFVNDPTRDFAIPQPLSEVSSELMPIVLNFDSIETTLKPAQDPLAQIDEDLAAVQQDIHRYDQAIQAVPYEFDGQERIARLTAQRDKLILEEQTLLREQQKDVQEAPQEKVSVQAILEKLNPVEQQPTKVSWLSRFKGQKKAPDEVKPVVSYEQVRQTFREIDKNGLWGKTSPVRDASKTTETIVAQDSPKRVNVQGLLDELNQELKKVRAELKAHRKDANIQASLLKKIGDINTQKEHLETYGVPLASAAVARAVTLASEAVPESVESLPVVAAIVEDVTPKSLRQLNADVAVKRLASGASADRDELNQLKTIAPYAMMAAARPSQPLGLKMSLNLSTHEVKQQDTPKFIRAIQYQSDSYVEDKEKGYIKVERQTQTKPQDVEVVLYDVFPNYSDLSGKMRSKDKTIVHMSIFEDWRSIYKSLTTLLQGKMAIFNLNNMTKETREKVRPLVFKVYPNATFEEELEEDILNLSVSDAAFGLQKKEVKPVVEADKANDTDDSLNLSVSDAAFGLQKKEVKPVVEADKANDTDDSLNLSVSDAAFGLQKKEVKPVVEADKANDVDESMNLSVSDAAFGLQKKEVKPVVEANKANDADESMNLSVSDAAFGLQKDNRKPATEGSTGKEKGNAQLLLDKKVLILVQTEEIDIAQGLEFSPINKQDKKVRKIRSSRAQRMGVGSSKENDREIFK